MSRIANVDLDYVNKIKLFLKYLIEIEQFKPASIARAINLKSSKSITHSSLGRDRCFKLATSYHNNYISWCKNNSYELEDEFNNYISKLY